MHVDVAIIGAGIVGLATAYQLLQQNPALRIQVIEKENDVGLHQSGRNSGVVHSGVFYKPGSLKAKNCVEGRKTLLHFCDHQGIAYQRLSKLIVATNEAERLRLHDLLERGRANGAEGLEIINKERMQEIEPYVNGLSALHVPECHVLHFPDVTKRLAANIQKRGAELLLGQKVIRLHQREDLRIIETNNALLAAKAVMNCAGLFSDRIAQMAGEAQECPFKIIPFRGEYFEVTQEKRHLINGLIYPVPDPRFPFLGIHLTRMLNGKVEVGPNAVLALAREGYKKSDADFRDCIDMLCYKGFWKMLGRYWDVGFYEMTRSLTKKIFVRDVQKLVPALEGRDLRPCDAGVRAQVITKEGKLFDDFALQRQGRILHVLSAPSPAATASFAIGRRLADIYFEGMV